MFNVRTDNSLWTAGQKIDSGILAGLLTSIILIGTAVLFSGKLLNFIDPASLFIVLGGTVGATLIHFSVPDLIWSWRTLRTTATDTPEVAVDRIAYLVELAGRVRNEGLLVLDSEADQTSDPFLRKLLQLTVDGQSAESIQRIMENELRTSQARAARSVQVFETMGNYAPAMGLIGTLIGLIQMLGALDNPSTVGPAMAVALITTFYGAILANILCLPMAGKIRNRIEEETRLKFLTIEGVISIGRQENSIILEQRLHSYLTPEQDA